MARKRERQFVCVCVFGGGGGGGVKRMGKDESTKKLRESARETERVCMCGRRLG